MRNLMAIRPVEDMSFYVDIRAGMTKLRLASRNFANLPEY